MRNIILNGKRMISCEVTHAYLKRKLKLPPYYGRNLDALYDVLTEINEDVVIKLINQHIMVERLGLYGEKIIQVFRDAEEENHRLLFSSDDSIK